MGMYLHLVAYTFFIIIVPFYVHTHWYQALAAVIIHISVSGLIFAIFSQINHLNEPSLRNHHSNHNCDTVNGGTTSIRYVYDPQKVEAAKVGETNDVAKSIKSLLSSSWAVQQIESSNNFCPQSTLWYYLSNGLNLQIEHHLFPGINHCHLHKIQPIVQEICTEYGIQYKCYSSWYDVMRATLQWLEKLSVASSSANNEDSKTV
jgi:Fatty acid desaturase